MDPNSSTPQVLAAADTQPDTSPSQAHITATAPDSDSIN